MLIIITGSSGSGKKTLAKEILNSVEGVSYHKSVTTRPVRDVEDTDFYEHISEDEFRSRINQKFFIEWEHVNKDLYYGTQFISLSILNDDSKVLVCIKDVKTAEKLKKIYGSACYLVCLKADDHEIIIERLKVRDGKPLRKEKIKRLPGENSYIVDKSDVVFSVDTISQYRICQQIIEELGLNECNRDRL